VRRGALILGVVSLASLAACKSSFSPPESHRPSDVTCPLGAPVSASPCDASSDCPLPAVCRAYDDAGLARYCNADSCDTDTDCADAGVCLCGSAATSTAIATPNVCLAPGNCRVDADCTPVHDCSPSSTGCGTAFSYYCHTSNDDCGNDSDCRNEQFCQYAPRAGKWTCVSAGACGG
jgi:hypothetical protein